MHHMTLRRLVPAFVVAIALSACADSIPGPGTMTVTLKGPWVTEGAALISIFGDGITGVTQINSRVFGEHDTATFAAATSMNLGFDDNPAAEFLGNFACLRG